MTKLNSPTRVGNNPSSLISSSIHAISNWMYRGAGRMVGFLYLEKEDCLRLVNILSKLWRNNTLWFNVCFQNSLLTIYFHLHFHSIKERRSVRLWIYMYYLIGVTLNAWWYALYWYNIFFDTGNDITSILMWRHSRESGICILFHRKMRYLLDLINPGIQINSLLRASLNRGHTSTSVTPSTLPNKNRS